MDLLLGLKGHLGGWEISWDYWFTWKISADSSTIFAIAMCIVQFTMNELAIEHF